MRQSPPFPSNASHPTVAASACSLVGLASSARRFVLLSAGFAILAIIGGGTFDAQADEGLPEALRSLPSQILLSEGAGEDERAALERMLSDDVRGRLRAVNLKEAAAWKEITSREAWETFRDARIAALRRSLGQYPEPPADLKLRVTRTVAGTGYFVDHLVFESRPGLLVTAHLYRPQEVTRPAPGLLIIHSHHRPKEQGELQDMGAMWARLGCYVLVPDQLGHGERRQHPFRSSEDFDGEFRVSRQDYFFRYFTGMQLHLLGDSQMGWMIYDLQRCLDVLLKQPQIDADKLVALGAVAGGGDPCGVLAAVEPRLAGAVPFNFGGPQPETRYPADGEDPETAFNYMGGGSWESTRNLRLSARDGFLHYVIVGATAPRPLVYAHEFTWQRDRDPVWKRFQTIWSEWYGVPENLAFTFGYGSVRLSSGQASHCTNIGAHHRRLIYPAFERWFGIPQPAEEFSERRETDETLCLTSPDGEEIEIAPMIAVAGPEADARMEAFRRRLSAETPDAARKQLQARWTELLGEVAPYEGEIESRGVEERNGLRIERFVMRGEREIAVPALLLSRSDSSTAGKAGTRKPLVIAVAQAGKEKLMRERAEALATLLDSGAFVCLPDLRGTGETRPGNDRGRSSWSTGISSSELLLGQTLVGARLKDVRTLLRVLRQRKDVDADRMALWGDSLAAVNGPDVRIAVPLDARQPEVSEPLGQLLALLVPLFEDDLRAAVAVRGGLVGFRSALDSQFCYFPHDVVIPEVLTAGDLPDLAAACAPRPLWIGALVDETNRAVPADAAQKAWRPALEAYEQREASAMLALEPESDNPREAAQWLLEKLKESTGSAPAD